MRKRGSLFVLRASCSAKTDRFAQRTTNHKPRTTLLAIVLAFTAASVLAADLEMQTRIRQEGFRNSKVMETASGLMDGIGPRLTGSPNMKRANEWTKKKLEELGLTNAHLESWEPFGRGWSYELSEVRLVSPDVAQLEALPLAWTPGTNGAVRGVAVKMKADTAADLEKYKGKIAGKVVMLGEPRTMEPHTKAELQRYDEAQLQKLEAYEIPGRPRFTREEVIKRRQAATARRKFFADEKPLAVIIPGDDDFGTVHVQGGGTQKPNEQYPVPSVAMADEHFGRILRLIDAGQNPEVELNIKATYYDDAKEQFNTIAEIPGTTKKDEIVMLGGHLDSWHGGTGATDNGAGVVVAMEAVRILKAIGIAPKRTIRIALWSGEEQGLLGSRAYVAQHFASRPEPAGEERDLPASMQRNRGPLTIKPEQAKVSAYFNLDNGTGKIRGIYTQANAAVVPIFEDWIKPLRDLGVTAITQNNTGGTDHLSFDDAGIPGFQFIQDKIEYNPRTHHTNYDDYERLQRDDLMQAAVVMATFVWEAANRPEMMPRKPLITDSSKSNAPERPSTRSGGSR